jgi:hypothetical protein
VRGAAYARTAITVEQYSTPELGFRATDRQGLGFTGTAMVTGKRAPPLERLFSALKMVMLALCSSI